MSLLLWRIPLISSLPVRITHEGSRLAAELNGGVAVLFAAEEPVLDFMPYRQDSDFYYLTGWNEPGAALMVVAASQAAGA